MRVMERAAPARYAAVFCCHFWLVARKMALRSCGPAIITNASGRIVRRFTIGIFRLNCQDLPPLRMLATGGFGNSGPCRSSPGRLVPRVLRRHLCRMTLGLEPGAGITHWGD